MTLLSKFVPITETKLIRPGFEDTVKAMVAETPVAALTWLDTVTEGLVRTPAVIAANVAVPLSRDASVLLAKVVTVILNVPCGTALFFSP